MYFYGWWQTIVCFFAFAALLAIWWHLGRNRKDYGQVWLALSILCWSISGIFELIFASGLMTGQYLLEGLRSITSLFNSLFILLALPWFKYLPGYSSGIIKSRFWHWIIGLPFLFSLLPTLRKMYLGGQRGSVAELDVYFATLTLIFLAGVLWTSFNRRRLPILGILSLTSIGITFAAQLYKLTDASISMPLFSAIFKSCLIMLFFALALSWVKELSQNVIPKFSEFLIRLDFTKSSSDRIKYLLHLSGIPGIEPKPIPMTKGNYMLMKKFVAAKLNDDQWLEIKPKEKDLPNRIYDINDYNEIKRLIHSILDGLFGKGSWTTDHHYLPLKNELFDTSSKRPRNIRLRILADQILEANQK